MFTDKLNVGLVNPTYKEKSPLSEGEGCFQCEDLSIRKQGEGSSRRVRHAGLNAFTSLLAVSQGLGAQDLSNPAIADQVRNDISEDETTSSTTPSPTLSWICSTLPEFRICGFATVCSICSLSGLVSRRPSANPLPLGDGEATSSHTALDAVSQDIASSLITILVTNHSTIYPFTPLFFKSMKVYSRTGITIVKKFVYYSFMWYIITTRRVYLTRLNFKI